MELLAGDVVLTRGSGLLPALIRVGEEPRGSHEKARVNHAGLISVGGAAQKAMVIESLPEGTVERKFSAYKSVFSRDIAVVYRNPEWTDAQRAEIVRVAREYVGRKYGWLRIAAIAGDWLTGSKWFFRGKLHDDDHPVCSMVVAVACLKGAKYRFRACDVDDVTPEDIWDDVSNNCPPWVPVGCA